MFLMMQTNKIRFLQHFFPSVGKANPFGHVQGGAVPSLMRKLIESGSKRARSTGNAHQLQPPATGNWQPATSNLQQQHSQAATTESVENTLSAHRCVDNMVKLPMMHAHCCHGVRKSQMQMGSDAAMPRLRCRYRDTNG